MRIEPGNPDEHLQDLLDDGEPGVVEEEERCSPGKGLGKGLLLAAVKREGKGESEVERGDECEEAEDQKRIE